MDSNTFALAFIAVIALPVSVLIWQLFATARTRMQVERSHQVEGLDGRVGTLDARITALVDDVADLASRLAALEQPR